MAQLRKLPGLQQLTGLDYPPWRFQVAARRLHIDPVCRRWSAPTFAYATGR